MSNSSVPQTYSITLDDTTIDLSNLSIGSETLTVTNGGTFNHTSSFSTGTVTLNSGSMASTFGGNYIGDTITFNNDWIIPQEWENSFPDWDRIQSMCNTYPGLKIAFEKFKTTYYLVKDDYDNPTDQK